MNLFENDPQNPINQYNKELKCVYKDRTYFVRDNGAVYRLCKEDGITRKYDEEWTFGRYDKDTGYMLIGSERVHRIVCTAFHGEPSDDRNIVDHIDTNRRNNRAENLRWVSKLENMLDNPITRAKIEMICGSIEAFIHKPSLLFGHENENTNFSWMRAVSPAEAKASYERWMEWSRRPVEDRKNCGPGLGPGNWIYAVQHITYNCKQIKCPQESSFANLPFAIPKDEDGFQHYIALLKPGEIFLATRYYKLVIEKVHHFERENKIRVLTKRINKDAYDPKMPWQIYEVWQEGTNIVHEHVATYGKRQYDDCEKTLVNLGIYKLEDWKFKQVEDKPINYVPSPKSNIPEISKPHPLPEPEKEYHTAQNIIQLNWKTPTEFPLCPKESTEDGLNKYMNNLKKGEIYCRNRYGESTLVDYSYNEKNDEIIVMTHTPNSIKEWGLNKIYYEDGIFVHESLHMYFYEEGARKYFTIACGQEWTGGDVFDDYC